LSTAELDGLYSVFDEIKEAYQTCIQYDKHYVIKSQAIKISSAAIRDKRKYE